MACTNIARLAVVVVAFAGSGGVVAAQPAQSGVPALQDLAMDQRLDQPLPLEVVLRDEEDHDVRLGDYFMSGPVVLALVYYRCPMLCPLALDGLRKAVRGMSLEAGRDFQVIAVSFDPTEDATLAAAARRRHTERDGRGAAGWHFLTGSEASIASLTRAVGFRYQRDPATAQYAHASFVVIATPEGVVSQYVSGVDYPPRDLQLGLVEAAAGQVGSVIDQVLLFCFHYDPARGRYSLAVLNLLRVAGTLTVMALAAFVAMMERRERAHGQGESHRPEGWRQRI